MKLEDSVLLLLLKFDRAEDISKALNVRVEDVKHVLRKLEAEGFVQSRKKGFLIKREVFELTKAGFERATEIKSELEKFARELERMYEREPERVKEVVGENALLLPLLITFGLINLPLLSMLAELNEVHDFEFDFDSVEF